MKKFTDDQLKLFGILEKSIAKLQSLQAEAKRCNLLILEKTLIGMAKELREGLELQARAFRDNTLVDHEPLFPTGFFPYGRKD